MFSLSLLLISVQFSELSLQVSFAQLQMRLDVDTYDQPADIPQPVENPVHQDLKKFLFSARQITTPKKRFELADRIVKKVQEYGSVNDMIAQITDINLSHSRYALEDSTFMMQPYWGWPHVIADYILEDKDQADSIADFFKTCLFDLGSEQYPELGACVTFEVVYKEIHRYLTHQTEVKATKRDNKIAADQNRRQEIREHSEALLRQDPGSLEAGRELMRVIGETKSWKRAYVDLNPELQHLVTYVKSETERQIDLEVAQYVADIRNGTPESIKEWVSRTRSNGWLSDDRSALYQSFMKENEDGVSEMDPKFYDGFEYKVVKKLLTDGAVPQVRRTSRFIGKITFNQPQFTAEMERSTWKRIQTEVREEQQMSALKTNVAKCMSLPFDDFVIADAKRVLDEGLEAHLDYTAEYEALDKRYKVVRVAKPTLEHFLEPNDVATMKLPLAMHNRDVDGWCETIQEKLAKHDPSLTSAEIKDFLDKALNGVNGTLSFKELDEAVRAAIQREFQ